jgi:hypothetical protein
MVFRGTYPSLSFLISRHSIYHSIISKASRHSLPSLWGCRPYPSRTILDFKGIYPQHFAQAHGYPPVVFKARDFRLNPTLRVVLVGSELARTDLDHLLLQLYATSHFVTSGHGVSWFISTPFIQALLCSVISSTFSWSLLRTAKLACNPYDIDTLYPRAIQPKCNNIPHDLGIANLNLVIRPWQ